MLPRGNQPAAWVVVTISVVGAIGILWYSRPTGWRLLLTMLFSAFLVAAGAFIAVVLVL